MQWQALGDREWSAADPKDINKFRTYPKKDQIRDQIHQKAAVKFHTFKYHTGRLMHTVLRDDSTNKGIRYHQIPFDVKLANADKVFQIVVWVQESAKHWDTVIKMSQANNVDDQTRVTMRTNVLLLRNLLLDLATINNAPERDALVTAIMRMPLKHVPNVRSLFKTTALHALNELKSTEATSPRRTHYFQAVYDLSEKQDWGFRPVLLTRSVISDEKEDVDQLLNQEGFKQWVVLQKQFQEFMSNKGYKEDTKVLESMCDDVLGDLFHYLDVRAKWAKNLYHNKPVWVDAGVVFERRDAAPPLPFSFHSDRFNRWVSTNELDWELGGRCIKAKVKTPGPNDEEALASNVCFAYFANAILHAESRVWESENEARKAYGLVCDVGGEDDEDDDDEMKDNEDDAEEDQQDEDSPPFKKKHDLMREHLWLRD